MIQKKRVRLRASSFVVALVPIAVWAFAALFGHATAQLQLSWALAIVGTVLVASLGPKKCVVVAASMAGGLVLLSSLGPGPLPGDNGLPLAGCVILVAIVTSRWRLAVLSAAESGLHNAVDGSDGAVVLTDMDGVVLFANPMAQALFGADVELKGRNFGQPLSDRPMDIEVLNARGERVVLELRMSAADWAGEPACLMSLTDVTERVEHQALQRDYIGRVERLDRQKSDFLASVSHELRTPLTSISGYLELLQEQDAGELTQQQHRMLEAVSRNTVRLRSLIENVMVLSRIEGGAIEANFAEVSIHKLITRVSDELSLIAKVSSIELEVDPGPQTAIVLGDQASLDRALVNILSNAIKFSHAGGVVTLRGTLDRGVDRVLITCQDRGFGIPARDQADLFTRFFRASNATENAIPGTGLGLSIAKQIVEEHRGELRLTSVQDQGTTVVMDLPT